MLVNLVELRGLELLNWVKYFVLVNLVMKIRAELDRMLFLAGKAFQVDGGEVLF